MRRERLIHINQKEEWQFALKGVPHAFAHTWEYNHALSHSLTPTSHQRVAQLWLYVYENAATRYVSPIVERKWREHTDIATPYGFSGFAGYGDTKQFLSDWKNFAAEHGWVCGYIGLNPVLDQGAYESGESANEVFTTHQIYFVDLAQPGDERFESLSNNVVKQLRDWQKTGARLIHDQERATQFFIANYDEFTNRTGASSVYRFARQTLEELLAIDRVLLVGAENSAGQIEAASVFCYSDYGGEYLFNVSLIEGRHHSAALLWEGMLQLKARGIAGINLGGGVKAGDGLDEFKARFGGIKLPLRALKQIYRPEIYVRCCAEAGVEATALTDDFPGYRSVSMAVQQKQIEIAVTNGGR